MEQNFPVSVDCARDFLPQITVGSSRRKKKKKVVYGGETSFPSQVIRLTSTVMSHIDSMCLCYGFHGGSEGKESVYNAVNPGLIPGYGRSPGEGDGNPFQYSFQ